MRTLVEKIEKSAKSRLVASPDQTAAQRLAQFKNYLKVESQRLKMHHRAGAGGRDVCESRAAMVDLLLCHLWDTARNELSVQAQKEFPPLALVALGGYGRAELCPYSDLDLMFLHEGQVVAYHTKPLPALRKLMDGLLLPLWDLGFKVGHSVRSVADCVENSNDARTPKSMETKTSLIEARLITGNQVLFEKFQRTVIAKCVEGHEEQYLNARIEDQTARRMKFGDSPTMQEPNVKNGCGGLRDYQNLHWMAFFKYRTRTLAEMEQQELITPAERKQLERAYDFLLQVRNEMHYQVGRSQDVLQRVLQPAVALELGYAERSPSRRLERFMRDLYVHLRYLYLITRTLEERLALLPQRGRLAALGKFLTGTFRPEKEQLLDGFTIKGGQIHYTSLRVFRDQPRRLMRVFLYAQQRGLKLHPDLAQLIRRELPLVDRAFLKDEHIRETFLEILNQRGNVGRILRTMHEVGFLGKYLPEFGKLTCLVQHEFYHVYSADEHTLHCLEQLDRVWEAVEPPYKYYAEYFSEVARPFVLYLAMLLHDSAKPLNQGDHAEAGGEIALRVARRLGLDGSTAHILRLLVKQHLTMAQVSQRRDLDDPAVIRHFAAQVQSLENLRMLTLHTLADSLGTSLNLWNGFKNTLLLELHQKSARVLAGSTEFIAAETRHRELLAEQVGRTVKRRVTPEEIAGHFQDLPPRYFTVHSVKDIAKDLLQVRRFMRRQLADGKRGLEPVITWHHQRDRGYSKAKICTWDRAGLFSQITCAFSAAGINILGAEVFTRTDKVVLDTFSVADARTGSLVTVDERQEFGRLLTAALTDEDFNLERLIQGKRPGRPLYFGLAGEELPTTIQIDNTASATQTVIEIETEDHLGLLFRISRALAELELNISLAKILTEKGAAVDTFYVTANDGRKILEAKRQKRIETELLEALAELK